MQHFLNHPLSERLHGYVKRPLRTESRGVDFTELPPALKAEALVLDGVVRSLDGKTPKRVIVVPRRIVNIVV